MLLTANVSRHAYESVSCIRRVCVQACVHMWVHDYTWVHAFVRASQTVRASVRPPVCACVTVCTRMRRGVRLWVSDGTRARAVLDAACLCR